MLRTDLDKPLLTGLSVVTRPPSRFVRLTCSGILIISCTFFGFSQCFAQDVADAARQAQARRESQQKKSKHVYTDEDLKRAQILTPEDRAQVEAKKNVTPPAGAAERSEDAVDAQALPADLPLGDVARRYRRMRESLRLQESAEFHLPFAVEPVLATPMPSVVIPAKPPVIVSPKPPVMKHGALLSSPAAPRFEPFQPPLKRSPFERPRIFFSAPPRVVTSAPSANHVAPPQAPAVGATLARPSTIPVTPVMPAAPAPIVRMMPSPSRILRVLPAQPAAPAVHFTPSRPSGILVTPPRPVAPAPGIRVMPSPSPAIRLAPVQPTAPVVRITPSQPSTVGVAPWQPAAPIVPATPSRRSIVSVTPTKPVAPVAPAAQAILNVVAVKPGDSLWKLAEQNLGAGLRWQDLLAVNPAIVDANRIMAGSQIYLPAAAPALRTATKITVQKGDTLSQIAQSQLGHASYARCIAQTNPAIRDANRIYVGQSLVLPASCKK